MDNEIKPYPGWEINASMSHDSTVFSTYNDKGVGILEFQKSCVRCANTFKAFEKSATQGVSQ